MTKSYEMNTIFETAINRQIEVQTAAYSFGEEAVSKCEVSFVPKDRPVLNVGAVPFSRGCPTLIWTLLFSSKTLGLLTVHFESFGLSTFLS